MAFFVVLTGLGLAVGAMAQTPRDEPIRPLPDVASLGLDQNKIELGQRLFFDPRLSGDNTVMCGTCHQFQKGGTDQLKVSIGIRDQAGNINAPTVFNSSLNFHQFWDGRAQLLTDQADGVIHNPKEFDSNWEQILPRLKADPSMTEAFGNTYKDGLTPANVLDALAEFEKTLLTPSRFDRYLKGDDSAITAAELEGYQRFKNFGCIACHQGVNVGGNMFQRFGALRDYFVDVAEHRPLTDADLGRYNVTKREEDRHMFKVPTLRNIANTAPYFHDASSETLEDAVNVMFHYQLGRAPDASDIEYIGAFLKSLTGEEYEEK